MGFNGGVSTTEGYNELWLALICGNIVTVSLKPFNICLHNIFKQQLNLSKEILQLGLEFIVVQDRKAYTLCAGFASKKEVWCQ